ncbi:4a-hydroxytetrahydrobiopterin dehydratase [Spongiibacter sp. KMU-158]|uniref:Putative pterin-4-alpha-carbinolamine dehydratase n=1 Tax=Spongiibacter pelagi TaxID=2760804 RepID=A0A927C1N7_9GAMM|nr:4a-hydroxytetrahydrobiopterin dehydratase [Spongiibacter pelagi]MBD2859649.1 4a-hydroxytetrahydrobiopterin dehydratase [Spongiibacter pelagi]
MKDALTESELQQALKGLPQWQQIDNQLYRQFRFKNFAEAFAFMTQVAEHAEAMNHHPDWSNSYNKVDIYLSSHDIGKLSQRDIALAAAIDLIKIDVEIR